MNIVPMTQEELDALKVRRIEQLKVRSWWQLSADEVARAYAAGLRDFSHADLRFADLRFANLSDADLRFANLRFANLSDADLSDADLRFANLRNADLRNADLRYTDLRNADLRNADLRNADLRYTDLPDTVFIAQVCLPGMSSRSDYLCAYADEGEGKLRIIAGCFNGTVAEFKRQVTDEKGKDALYLDALKPIVKAFKLWQARQPEPAKETTDASAS